MNAIPGLQARDVSTTRGDRLLFNSLWLELEPGQALQIHGPNGSGKTTLLRVLCTLTPPDTGSIHWRGRDVLADRSDYLRELAYVGHAHGIKDELTALENLRISRRLGQPAPDTGLRDALSRTGLGELAHEPARHFSAGARPPPGGGP
ncbi:MAG: ATP-binding cassette domain-containing protein, partial [Ectothiorhodospiraceae bacterium]|nr:ATP-binding cassette domain-containing protein [Ectothiorhodospiraceae bacterium]